MKRENCGVKLAVPVIGMISCFYKDTEIDLYTHECICLHFLCILKGPGNKDTSVSALSTPGVHTLISKHHSSS